MKDVQPVLDQLDAVAGKLRMPWVTTKLVLYPDGDGAVVIEDIKNDRILAAVDFEAESNMLDAVDKLEARVSELVK